MPRSNSSEALAPVPQPEEQKTIKVLNTDSKPWYLDILQKQGLPVVIILIAMTYLTNSLFPWLQKEVTELVTWHKETVNKLQENSQEQVKANIDLVSQQRELAHALQSNSAILKEAVTASRQMTEEQIPILKKIDEGINNLGVKVETTHKKLLEQQEEHFKRVIKENPPDPVKEVLK